MHLRTKFTFFILVLLGIGLLVWWLPLSKHQTIQAEHNSGTEIEVVDAAATTVTEPVPSESVSLNPTPEPQERIETEVNEPQLQVREVIGEVVQLEIIASRDQRDATACGPTAYGEVAWGNGVSETVYGLGCSASRQTLDISHAYEEYGEYTITFTDERGRKTALPLLVGGEYGDEPRMGVSISE